ncbi:MAG TPA: hypothetical protein VFU46_03675 [Gemmatimonadales bacterium]|nr:hypothetical protein [Gemmatimonadales bacterium]
MPLRPLTIRCPRCGRPTPLAGALPWIGAGTLAAVMLAAAGLVIWARLSGTPAPPAGGTAHDSLLALSPPIGNSVLRGDSVASRVARPTEVRSPPPEPHPPADLGRPAAARSPANQPGRVPDRNGTEINRSPPDLMALEGSNPAARRRSVLEAVLRRGLVDSLQQRSPRVVRVFVGRAFFRQEPRFRDPLFKSLDEAWTEGPDRRRFELWWDTFPLGEYAGDTFYFGKWYYEFR